MKNFRKLMMAVVATALSACTSDSMVSDDADWAGEIKLGANVLDAGRTRAATDIQGNLFDASEQIAVFVEENQSTGQTASSVTTYPKALYTVGTVAEGDVVNSLSTSPVQYYPSSGNAVSIYAFYPNTVTDKRILGESDADVTFTIAQDQSETSGYKASDLMFAKETNGKRQKAAHKLNFAHKLSKVIVKLKAGDGYNDAALTDEQRAEMLGRLEDAKVEILGVKPTVTLAKDAEKGLTGEISAATVDASNNTYDVTVISQTALDASTTTDIYDYVAGACILPPQTFSRGDKYLKITLKDKGVLYYTLTADEQINAGEVVTYTLTVNLTGITLTSDITNWNPGTDHNDWKAGMDDVE